MVIIIRIHPKKTVNKRPYYDTYLRIIIYCTSNRDYRGVSGTQNQ